MNAKLLGFFSGFPTHHFPLDIAKRLREELTCRDSLVFVSAWPVDYERNDSDSAGMYGMFEECNMPFKQYSVIDNRTDAFDAKQLIREASCIFLMGGHAVQQFQLICEKGILEEIRKSAAVILGVSAGSGNMAKRALDIWESLVPYEGLGLEDITIKAHITQENQELQQTLLQVSQEQNLPICAMEDESAIFVKNDCVTYLGQIYWVNQGKICHGNLIDRTSFVFARRNLSILECMVVHGPAFWSHVFVGGGSFAESSRIAGKAFAK